MKGLIQLSILVCLMISCGGEKSPSYQSYGAVIEPNEVQSISNLDLLMKDTDSISTTLTAQIEKTCAVKGCWMQLKTTGKGPLRVTFENYAFFVPKSGVEGKTATLQGYCIKQETSVEELQHYALDAGESEEFIASITAPKMEYNFVANGVIIED